MFLTPNGRWETKTKICLSITAFHAELWQPAWGIRTILEALISFMPTPADGAVGALDYTPAQRKRLAAESLNYSDPLMPELPPLKVKENNKNDSTKEEEKEKKETTTNEETNNKKKDIYKERIVQLGFRAPIEEEEEENVKKKKQEPPVQEEEEPGEVETNQVIRNRNAVVVVVPSPMDDRLRYISYAIMFTILAVLYRKLLVTYSLELN